MGSSTDAVRTQKRKVVEAIVEIFKALTVTSAVMTDELRHVTTSLIEMFADEEVDE